MRAHSLRWRLALLAALSIIGTLSAAGLSIAYIFERHIERRIESELDVRLSELLGAFAVEEGAPKMDHSLSDPRYAQPFSGAYWQISGPDGTVLQSRSLWDRSIALRDKPANGAQAYEVRWPTGATLYVLDRQVTLEKDGKRVAWRLAVALDHAEIDAINTDFSRDLLKALGVIGVVLLAGAWLQINLGLRPLRQVRKRVAAIQRGQATRLEGEFPAELAPLAEDFNALLARQEERLRKGRERAGALAHGLKTPLTILTGEAARLDDVGLTEPATALREQVGAMRNHVERELARARSHGSAAPGGLFADARASVDRLVDLVRRMPRGEAIAFANQIPPGLRVQVDPDDFGEIAGNLLDNARKHARAAVRIFASVAHERALISVEDDGPGIPAQWRERLTQRGESATPGGDSSGLGLAIVCDLLADYGSELVIADRVGGGCKLSFAVPCLYAAADRRPSGRQDAVSPAPGAAMKLAR